MLTAMSSAGRPRWLWLAGVVLIGCSAVRTAAEQRQATLAETDTIQVTTPTARVIADGPTANGHTSYLRLWVSDDGVKWREVFRSSGYDAVYATLPGPAQPRTYDVLLDGFPRYVRAGLTDYYTGSVFVDSVQIIAPDGEVIPPTAAIEVNRAANVANALVTDGKTAAVRHTVGTTPQERAQVDAVQLTFAYSPRVLALSHPTALPAVEQPPLKIGVYTTSGSDNDPHDVPPGYVYHSNAADIARYDFSILQSNNPGLIRQIKAINPRHRVIIRLWLGGPVVLDYAYDPVARQRILDSIFKQIEPDATDLYGVCLSEEELQHMFQGWYGSAPPAWLLKWRGNYEAETGNTFQFRSTALREWLAGKAKWLHSDLYDQIKARYPKLRVMPFCYVPGDISGWGWFEPAEVKADGWVYQWHNDAEVDVLKPCRHVRPDITRVAVRERWFDRAIAKLRAAGVPTDDLYVQVWAYRKDDDACAQIREVRKAGIANVFCFYYCGWVVPAPPQIENRQDLSFRLYRDLQPATFAAVQESSEGFTPVGSGLAESFIATSPTVAAIAFNTKPASSTTDHVVRIEGDDNGLPDGKPVAQATLPASALEHGGRVQVDLHAELQSGRRYWLTLRSQDGAPSPIEVASSSRDPYHDGQMLRFDVHGDYYRNWRSYDIDRIGIGSWRASYEQRWRVESFGLKQPALPHREPPAK